MKKSLKKILFTVLTVFAVFFVVACGNKEDAKINKEEVLQKSAEAYKNIKSADMLINLKMEPKKSAQPMELTMDVSITLEPIAMKMSMDIKDQNVKLNSFIKDDIMYIQNPVDNSWIKQALPEDVSNQFKNMVNSDDETYEVLKTNLDKVNIKEEGGNYIISVTKDTDFLKEAIKKQNSKVNMAGQNLDLNVDNVTLEYVVDKETYDTKSSVVAFDTNIQGQDVRMTVDSAFSNVNNIKEITVPEEALNATATPAN